MGINEGGWDRAIRILAGVALAYAAWVTWPATAGIMSRGGIVSLVFLAVGAIALATGVLGFCPGYAMLDVSTKKGIRHA